MPYVLLCTGSRDLADATLVDEVLDRLLAEHPHLVIRVGDCRRWDRDRGTYKGADWYVYRWARRTWGAGWRDRCRVYVARWGELGDYAGPERNGRMVADGADEGAAWFAPVPVGVDPATMNRGTAGCVKLARRAGIPVVTYGLESVETEQETLPL